MDESAYEAEVRKIDPLDKTDPLREPVFVAQVRIGHQRGRYNYLTVAVPTTQLAAQSQPEKDVVVLQHLERYLQGYCEYLHSEIQVRALGD